MAVSIRLQRHGSTHKPFYHVVATDRKNPRDGRFIEKLGYYDPNAEPSIMHLDEVRAQHWYQNGAELSPAVATIIKKKKIVLSRKPLTAPSGN